MSSFLFQIKEMFSFQ